MARTDALSIYTNAAGSTADKLAESYGKVIESIQKGALSEQLKNKDYSGDPTTGSVKYPPKRLLLYYCRLACITGY